MSVNLIIYVMNIIVVDKSSKLSVYKYSHKFGNNTTESDIEFYIERQGHDLSKIDYYWSEDPITTFKHNGTKSVYYSGFDSLMDMIEYIKSNNVCLTEFKREFGINNLYVRDLEPCKVDNFLCKYIK